MAVVGAGCVAGVLRTFFCGMNIFKSPMVESLCRHDEDESA